ncbi:protein of unknown function [Pseudodesulfovibrio profundus]|uniref:Uncharacterized protein n=1 Tax=Pseudodesulfovibrio profundus TaxID=57320 RepID=A0A2C8FCS7_9BACT|nr:protein of unknown function [Pseudodesulfovibrio profundus]
MILVVLPIRSPGAFVGVLDVGSVVCGVDFLSGFLGHCDVSIIVFVPDTPCAVALMGGQCQSLILVGSDSGRP